MIAKLTEDQKKDLKVFRDKYIQIGLNTDRINREEAKQTIEDLYVKILKRGKPRKTRLDESLSCHEDLKIDISKICVINGNVQKSIDKCSEK